MKRPTPMPEEPIFQTMDAITDSVSNGCVPQVPIDISIEHIDGKSVIALDVFAGARCPYYIKSEGAKDGVYLRVGATTRAADDAAIHDLTMDGMGRRFDREACAKAKIDDVRIKALCAKMYRIARANCRNETEKKTVKRVTETQLESWGIVSRENGRWIGSNAYAMLTGDKSFPIRIRCGVFKGDTKAIFVDRREFTGSLSELIDKAHEYILAKINMGMKIVGAQRRDVYELPPDEMRELIVNAFAHRNYFDHEAPIFIAVYDTRVEITSPGSLPRGLTAEKALAGCSKIRNRAIASALTYMRYVEGWGSGLLRVSESLENHGLPPLEVIDDVIDVRVNVHRRKVNATAKFEDLKVPIDTVKVPIDEVVNLKKSRQNCGDEVVNEVVSDGVAPNCVTVNRKNASQTAAERNSPVTVNVTVDGTVNVTASGEIDKLVLLIKEHPGRRADYYAKQMGRTRRSVMRYLSTLSGKVEFRGAPKTGGYYCI